ncbi:hypothetical protein TELCIR_00044 [Teladorsagia circumcincta]|uniref:Uncharacterized protein n=1 Tax=Teladorsagia circumcincta TaxID=45464 RepID=A0A2G9V722_TELCI|nr:hypothetical protein TELCIR_00044 [Teladorsagia circumcincta]
MSQLSMLSGEKSAELAKAAKGAKKGAYPTMASEMKRKEAEAAAREAARVRENERRIAESAIRRRARDAAAAAVAAQTPSDKDKQDTPSSNVPSTLDKTQYSQKSVSKRARSRHDSVQRPPPSPYQLPRLTMEEHRKPRAPVALRTRPSNDGRHPDALGASRIKSSPSSSSKQTPDDSRSQKTSSTKSEVKSVSSTVSEVKSGPSAKSEVKSVKSEVRSAPSVKPGVKSVPSPISEEKSWSGTPQPAQQGRQDRFLRRKSSRS